LSQPSSGGSDCRGVFRQPVLLGRDASARHDGLDRGDRVVDAGPRAHRLVSRTCGGYLTTAPAETMLAPDPTVDKPPPIMANTFCTSVEGEFDT